MPPRPPSWRASNLLPRSAPDELGGLMTASGTCAASPLAAFNRQGGALAPATLAQAASGIILRNACHLHPDLRTATRAAAQFAATI